MTRTENLHELAGAYALDALDAEELERFEAHLRTCAQCQTEVAEFQAVAMALGESQATSAPSHLKADVMAEIGRTRQLPPTVSPSQERFGQSRFGRLAPSQSILAVAAAVALLLVGVVALTRPDTDPTTEVVSADDAIVAVLDPLEEAQQGTVQVVWSDDRDQVAVIASDLGDPGDGNAYALWFLLDDGVAPAGLFTPEDGSVSAVLDIDDRETTGWGITIEPDTGSEQPTTPVLFAGTV